MDEDDTESPSSKGSGLTHILSKKGTRNRKNRDSSSLKSLESDGRGLRASLSDKIERVRPGGDDGGNEHSGLRKLIPKAMSSKRRQREQEEEQAEREEAARGRSIAERGTLRSDIPEVRLASAEGDAPDGSSLLTYESDIESPNEIRPSLSQHSSHAGYLTTSSPLVHATTFSPPASLEAQLDGPPRSNTLPSPFGALGSTETTPALVSSKLHPPSNESRKRPTSPVGRLKEAFSPRRSNQTSPERQTQECGTASSQANTYIDSSISRRGSIGASKLGIILTERQATAKTRATSSPERPPPAKIRPINTNTPRTPPSEASEDNTPVIVNTPPTPTHDTALSLPSEPIKSNPNVVTSPSGNMISHRRVRSGSINALGPSKLSNITSAPLTPTRETAPAPAITPSGFFSSVFSAAQNAANTLSNSIGNTSVAPGRSRSGTQERKEIESPEVETLGNKTEAEDSMEEKELAIKTLGTGDLSLSHLGISETHSGVTTPLSSKFQDDLRGKNEDALSKVSTAPASTLSDVESNTTTQVDDIQSLIRPRSVYEASPNIPGEQTPPNGSVFEGKGSVQRSGSIRSAIGTRRKRNSSTTTGTTIGAAIVAANASLAHPQGSLTPKITGFAVASKKRNRDFHQLFRSVPDDDYLIEDYSCALQREILAHGRLYVSEGHLCFSSNIFGWVTTLVMSFDEIVSVEKRSTALVFKNGLMISTLQAKHIFASFTSRDSTYDLIVGIWKLGHPSLRSSLNGVTLDETGGDKTEKTDDVKEASQSGSASEDDSEEGDEVYDEDEDDEDGLSVTHADGSIAGSENADKVVSRKPSNGAAIGGLTTDKGREEGGIPSIPDFPGPLTHSPTECTDQDSHYSKVLADEVIPAPLGKIYSLMFGPESLAWMRNWLTVEQKSLDLTMDDKKFLSTENKVRTYSYIKPLNGAIGPKQTKCLSTETLDFIDLEKAVSVTIATQTPDVPSGNVFSTKTRYCLSWAEGNATRLHMGCTIEWTGKSWLKGPIEKGANDGQSQYAKDIVASLRAAVSSRRPTAAHPGGRSKKKTRKGKESKTLSKNLEGVSPSKQEATDWGLFEFARQILEPILDIVKPLIGGNVTYILFGILLLASWFRFGIFKRSPADLSLGLFSNTPARMAAYEELWRREESDLWDWLEDRVGMERVRDVGQMPIEKRIVGEKLKEQRMEEREVKAAIRVTEEKLHLLKSIVESKSELNKVKDNDEGKEGLDQQSMGRQEKSEKGTEEG